MSVEQNKQLVRDTWGAISAGDSETFLNNLADDISWTFFGSHRFAGTFRGKDELLAKLLAPIGDVLADGIKISIESMTAEGDCVVVEASGEAKSKSGADYNNSYCMVVTVGDGKVRQVREYLDSELVTRVFAR